MGEGIGWDHSPFPASGAHGRRGALREPWIAALDAANETREACGAPISPPALRLPRVGQSVARKSMGEGIGWDHSPFPASEAVGARGERSLPVTAHTTTTGGGSTTIGMLCASVLGPEEPGPVSLSEAVLPEAEGSVG